MEIWNNLCLSVDRSSIYEAYFNSLQSTAEGVNSPLLCKFED